MEWAPAATLTAAAIGVAGLVYQQTRHWRETRRDRLRDAYAEWMGALARVRRVEERLLGQMILAHDTLRARRAAGDPLAEQGVLTFSEHQLRTMQAIEQDIDASNRDLDIMYGRICLLDRDRRRIRAAEAVRDMPTLVELQLGREPSETEFNQRWLAKSRAVGALAQLINRTLALEDIPALFWDRVERRLDKRQKRLHTLVSSPRKPE